MWGKRSADENEVWVVGHNTHFENHFRLDDIQEREKKQAP